MGSHALDQQMVSMIPSRPRFSWDSRAPPWTDARGDQEQYMRSVKLWKKYHDGLPNNNGNKIPAALQGVVLQSQLFGRAQDIGSKVSDEDITSPNGALILAKAICKKDRLSLTTSISEELEKLVHTKRDHHEKLRNFESRFDAQVCRMHHLCCKKILPESILALLLMANSNVENSQRVSVLDAVSLSIEEEKITKTAEAIFLMPLRTKR